MPGLDLIMIAMAYAPRLERRPTRAGVRGAVSNVAAGGRRRVESRFRALVLLPLVVSNRIAGLRRLGAR